MANPWVNWSARWEAALEACKRLGGTPDDLVIAEPATFQEVEAVEAILGIRLPESFRTVLLEFSSHVELSWLLPDDKKPTAPLRGIFSGECSWNLNDLPELEESRQGWIDAVFPDIEDPYDKIWHNKLTFLHVANGDQIALDLSERARNSVVYLSHEGDVTHGWVLGNDFIDFMTKWSLLGCPGAEDWQMKPFISSPTSGLDPNSDNAKLWREWFSLNLPNGATE